MQKPVVVLLCLEVLDAEGHVARRVLEDERRAREAAAEMLRVRAGARVFLWDLMSKRSWKVS